MWLSHRYLSSDVAVLDDGGNLAVLYLIQALCVPSLVGRPAKPAPESPSGEMLSSVEYVSGKNVNTNHHPGWHHQILDVNIDFYYLIVIRVISDT